jgi:hypothetical protein
MPNDKPPTHQVRQTYGGIWQVAVTWDDGRKEWHGSFKTEQEALTWARSHLRTWQERKTPDDTA